MVTADFPHTAFWVVSAFLVSGAHKSTLIWLQFNAYPRVVSLKITVLFVIKFNCLPLMGVLYKMPEFFPLTFQFGIFIAYIEICRLVALPICFNVIMKMKISSYFFQLKAMFVFV